jgi:hypothetical protein
MVARTDGVARWFLLVLGIVDLVCGAVGLLAAHELAHILGTSTAVPIVIACLPLFVLGVAGLLAARCHPEELRGRLRLQSVLNGGYALGLVAVALTTTMHPLGGAVLVVVAVFVIGLALVEWWLTV